MSDDQTDNPNLPAVSSNTNVSGGAGLTAEGNVNVDGDVVGRDKIESAGGHIIHAGPNATVIINESPVPQPVDHPTQPPTSTASASPGKPNGDTLTALNQLEPPPADFTGRVKELAELLEAHQHGCRIFGLYGTGGVGKTTLATQFATHIKEQYSDAQIFLDLGGAGDHPIPTAEVMAHVIRAFDLSTPLPDDHHSLKGLYQSRLHNKCSLILLDNAKDAAQVELFRPPENCCLIITSRERFMLPGSHAINVSALTVDEARALLLKIAPRVGDRANEIAQLCGCFPFALRQVGASIAGGERTLEESAQFLTDPNRRWKLIDPQKTAFEMRYGLLDEHDKTRWRVLAMFPSEFTALEASALWNLNLDAADEHLNALRRRSLIERSEQTGGYFLLDLMRDYLRESITRTERTRAQRNIIKSLEATNSFGYKLAMLFGKQLRNPGWPLPKIRPAVLEALWNLVDGDHQPEERLAAALQLLSLHWWSDKANMVGIEQLIAFLELVAAAADTSVQRYWLIECITPWLSLELDPRQRAQLFIHRAALQAQLYQALDETGRVSKGGEELSAMAKHDYDHAEQIIHPIIDASDALAEDRLQLARIYIGKGNFTIIEAEIRSEAESHELLLQALGIYLAGLKVVQGHGEHPPLLAGVLHELCNTYALLKDWENALEQYTQAMDLLETELFQALEPHAYATLYFAVQNSAAQMYYAWAETLIQTEQNDARAKFDEARRLYLDAIAQLEQSIGDSEDLAIAHFNVGDCFQALGELDEAHSHWQLACDVARRRGVWYVERMAEVRLNSLDESAGA